MRCQAPYGPRCQISPLASNVEDDLAELGVGLQVAVGRDNIRQVERAVDHRRKRADAQARVDEVLRTAETRTVESELCEPVGPDGAAAEVGREGARIMRAEMSWDAVARSWLAQAEALF